MRTRTSIVLMVLALAAAIVLSQATLGVGAVSSTLPASPTDESKVPHYFGPYSNWANSPQVLPDALISFTGDGTGAEATATVDPKTGAITAIDVTAPGSGYTTPPTVVITSAVAVPTPASATAVLSTGALESVTVNESGFGFATLNAALTGGNPTTPATIVASGGVDNVELTNGGSGYAIQPIPVFSLPELPGGVQAQGTAVMNASGVVTSITVTNPGSGYTSAPTVVIQDGTLLLPSANRTHEVMNQLRADVIGPDGVKAMAIASAEATVTIALQQIDVTAAGAGYQTPPTVTITDTGGVDRGASATANIAAGGAVASVTVNSGGAGYLTPGIRKFVDTLPGLGEGAANNLGQYIPVAVPDTTTYPGSDYYEIAVVQYREQMHSDVPATLLRGYVQLSTSTVPGKHVALTNANLAGGTTPIAGHFGVDKPHYLGPTIVAQKDRPVRILFRNLLPNGAGGNLFLPVDTYIMGSGPGPDAMTLDADGVPMDMAPDLGTVMDGVRNPFCDQLDAVTGKKPAGCFTDDRATLHLHGGITPWISDGTPHQWITPAPWTGADAPTYPKGVSVNNVPDMPDPGEGAMTFFYTNQQSARLMFYHDHAWGITRLNVYAGEAAPYVIQDETEEELIADGLIPGAAATIPLVIQDKTFVPANIHDTDPTWDMDRWGGEGNLWLPHVYMPAQNPGDVTGMSAFGRWMYGPWFWPPASNVKYDPIANPYYDPGCDMQDPTTWQYESDPFCEPELIPGTANNSVGMEAFMDTPTVNGTAYPKTRVEPKAYRLRILNAANDRFWNLSWYVADPRTGTLSEVALNPTEVAAAHLDPNVFPTPDTTWSPAGPNWVQIGTEGGFLPAPNVIPAQPTTWITDPTVFNVGLVDKHSLLIAPAERMDAIVDFSQYRGKTLILYNDAPAAFPARVSQYDYYTGGPDLSPVGAPTTLAGYGPNTRTIMQVTVGTAAPATAFDRPNTSDDGLGRLEDAFAHQPDGSGVFESGQDPIIVGQAAYNSAYYDADAPATSTFRALPPLDGFARINDFSLTFNGLTAPNGSGTSFNIPFQPKSIHDEMNSAHFDEFGRMSANLGLEAPGATPLLQNTILYPFVNPSTENLNTANLPNGLNVTPIASSSEGTQIWKITHNGVDTHPIHFHLYDVQLLNRVTWDNIVQPPDPSELGWKDTVRVSPLEDTIVAVRPIIPAMPFGIPISARALNPMMPLGARGSIAGTNGTEAGFNNVDADGNPLEPIINQVVSFGWEYVWHCHILSHEEMDMMRPQVVNVTTQAPAAPVLTAYVGSPTSNTLNWTDGTTVTTTAGPTWGSPQNEIGYRIERATRTAGPRGSFIIGPYVQIGTSLANQTWFTDPSAPDGAAGYSYRVIAYNVSGNSTSNAAVASLPAPTTQPTVTNPNTGGDFKQGSLVPVSWTISSAASTGSFQVFLKNSDGAETLLTTQAAVAGKTAYSYSWTVTQPVGTGYTIIVRYLDAGNTVLFSDVSDVPFNIITDYRQPTVTSPNTALQWLQGTFHPVTWTIPTATSAGSFQVYLQTSG
ncbi:MAG: multicopper oxidase domain-containing protein, partial [Thermoleophilia bacterium]